MLIEKVKKVSPKLAMIMASSVLFASNAMAQGFIDPGRDNIQRVAEATAGETSARELVLTIVNYFLGFLGLFAVLLVIYGGVLYIGSAGNEDTAGKGKKVITYAVIGIIIILLSFVLINAVFDAGLGGDPV